MPRDFVYFQSGERVDLPDMDAMQRNARTDNRAGWLAFAYGASQAYTKMRRVTVPFSVTEDSPAASNIVVTPGLVLGIEELPDGSTLDKGAWYGNIDSSAAKNPDFNGLPADTYGVYVRYVQTPGSAATRVFWDPAASAEDPQGVNTRWVTGWEVEIATSYPGDEWTLIAVVTWSGSGNVTNSDIEMRQILYYEGDENNSYADDWGDDVNDRDSDRTSYGVHDHHTWVAAVRRQIAEIIGGSKGWYELPAVALDDHTTDSTNPHGTTLTQDALVVSDSLTAPALTEFSVTASDGAGDLDLTLDTIDMLASTRVSLEAAGNSDFTVTGSNTLSLVSEGGVVLSADGALDIDADTITMDAVTSLTVTVPDIDVVANTAIDLDTPAITFGNDTVIIGGGSDDIQIDPSLWGWTGTQTHPKCVHPLGFACDPADVGEATYDRVNGWVTPTGAADAINLMYTFDLPDGATLTTISGRFTLSTATGVTDMKVKRQHNSTGAVSTLDSASGGGASGAHSLDLSPGEVIDNELYSYWVEVELDNDGGAGTGVRFYAMEYAYTTTDVPEALGIAN